MLQVVKTVITVAVVAKLPVSEAVTVPWEKQGTLICKPTTFDSTKGILSYRDTKSKILSIVTANKSESTVARVRPSMIHKTFNLEWRHLLY